MFSCSSDVSCILPTLNDNIVTRVLVTLMETFEDITSTAYGALQCTNVKKKLVLTWKLPTDKKSSPAAHLNSASEWTITLECVQMAKSTRGMANREGVEIIIGVVDPLVFLLLFR